ncbi:PA2169 family four-helix-bundle protein [Terrimonas pollutisoli]|uniref:PA2169 family four-helix-bundle protein n=1 Tax=Terrimonas pollutisoli TaxID=3034147 RepID=UPI0023EBEFFD|nr:PA2169 family four-helix-bundle protein [Terrimonas sp. H1YJ31]
MNINEKTAEVLNDLVRINNDRIEGYTKAENETKAGDADLQSLFRQMAAESRSYVNDLSKYISATGNNITDDTTVRGKIYRAWMDVKATFSGKDRKAILASCEYGEDAAQKAYEAALSSDAELPTEVRQLIMDQKQSLKKSHDQIKALRDAQHA